MEFNFKSKQRAGHTKLLLAINLFLFLVILMAVLQIFSKPRWQEIKSSSSIAKAAILNAIESDKRDYATNNDADEPINFLVLGMAGEGYDAPDLTDTILVARLDLTKEKIYMFSLPRDLLVKIPSTNTWTKLNTLYALAKNDKGRELELIKQKTQEITGLPFAHHILVDLATVKNLVDILGGVNVMVKKDIFDPTFPGLNHSFETFEIKQGWRYLDGAIALKYIRTRHSGAGDLDRIERQQEVLQALKQKILQLSFWDVPTYLNIFNTISSEIKTDLSLWQIKNLWEQAKEIPAENLIKTDLGGANLVTTGQINLNGTPTSIVRPKAEMEDYGEIREYIENIIAN